MSPSEYAYVAHVPVQSFRLMGFGHRVYKNYDPRARLMRSVCFELLKSVGQYVYI